MINRVLAITLLTGIALNVCIWIGQHDPAYLETLHPIQTIKASSKALQPEEMVCGYPGAYTVLASALQPKRLKH